MAIVGRELDLPYHRPPTTKGYLQGQMSREDCLVCDATTWESEGIDVLVRTSVAALDLGKRRATLATKAEVSFTQALLATGARVRRLTVEGAELEGIHYLRSPGNADSLRRDLDGAEEVVCVGGSYIASEVAASLTDLGHRVTMIMLESEPLSRHFGPTVGQFVSDLLTERGVRLITNDSVRGFEGAEGRVTAVVTREGARVAADAVVCGIGALPDVALAERAGLELGPTGGVSCNARLRTSADVVFAAGDMCEYDSSIHRARVRIEHEDVAMTQGATAARNMLGEDIAYEVVPYFFSHLSDWVSIEYVGVAGSWEEQVLHGSPVDGAFAVSYLGAGQLLGRVSIGGYGGLDAARRMVKDRSPVSVAELRTMEGADSA